MMPVPTARFKNRSLTGSVSWWVQKDFWVKWESGTEEERQGELKASFADFIQSRLGSGIMPKL